MTMLSDSLLRYISIIYSLVQDNRQRDRIDNRRVLRVGEGQGQVRRGYCDCGVHAVHRPSLHKTTTNPINPHNRVQILDHLKDKVHPPLDSHTRHHRPPTFRPSPQILHRKVQTTLPLPAGRGGSRDGRVGRSDERRSRGQ